MQPRSLEQILGELNTTYSPQVESIRQRQALIPGQIQEEEKGLAAKQENAFGDILGGARRRGLGFSGIPLGEQAKYTASEYLPAIARLRQSGREQAMSLEDAILGINERRDTLAQQIRQQEIDRAEQIRQFEAQLAEQRRQQAAAAAAAFSPSYNRAATPTQNTNARPSLSSIFGGGSVQPLRVAAPRSQGNVLQPAGSLALQAPNSVRLQGSSPSLQGGSLNLNNLGLRLR